MELINSVNTWRFSACDLHSYSYIMRENIYFIVSLLHVCGFWTPRLPYASTVWRCAEDVSMYCKMILMWASFCFMKPPDSYLHSSYHNAFSVWGLFVRQSWHRPYSSGEIPFSVPYAPVFLPVFVWDLFLFLILCLNRLNPELNPICYLLALLGGHHFLHVSTIRVKLLTFRRLMSYIYIIYIYI